MYKFISKKNLDKLIEQTLKTTHKLLLNVLSENKIICPKLEDFENYIKELTKLNKEK